MKSRKEAIEQAYADQMKALQQELEDALIVEGVKEADLTANLNRRKQELQDSYDAQQAYIEDSYKDSAQYKNLLAKYQKDLQDLELGKRNGKKLTAKQRKTIQAEADKLAEEMEALAMGATDANITDYIKAWTYVYNNQAKYDAGKLTGDAAKKYDTYMAQLNAWNLEKSNQVSAISRELSDSLKQLELEYETQVAENEQAINEQKASLWETARELAEFEVTSTQALIDSLSAVIDRYEAVAHVLEDTNFEALKKYGIMDLFDLDDEADVTTLLTEQLTNAITSSVQKVSSLAEQVGLYEELLDAADSGSFTEIFAKYREQADEETQALVDRLVEQLESNDYTDNEWVTEWQQALSDALSEILSATESVEEFKSELREKVLFAAADESIAKAEALQSKLSSMASVIKDEWAIDQTTGNLTEFGLAKINVLTGQLRQAQQEVASYAEKIAVIQQAQQNENTAYKDEKAYLEALSEAEADYYNALVSVQNISDQIYQLGKSAQEAEIETLKRLTTARLDALNAKRAYYTYDSTIKKQTKDVQTLQAQISALNGVDYLPFLFELRGNP